MSCEIPDHPPVPGILADMCAERAWDDDVDDKSRRLLEWAADTIRSLVINRSMAINRAEHLEAEVETYVAMIYGPGKGKGAK